MLLFPKLEDKLKLEITIKSLREEMIKAGVQEGLNHEKTILISQKLDFYIAEYQALKIAK